MIRNWLSALRGRRKAPRREAMVAIRRCLVGQDFEALEQRDLFTAVTWVGGATGYWDVAANWSNNAIPNQSADVTIGASSAATITIRAGDVETIHSLLVANNDTLSMTGGSLTLANNSTNNGTLNQTGGTFTADAGLTNTGAITVSPGCTMTIEGAYSQAAGAALSLPTGSSQGNSTNLFTNSSFESPQSNGSAAPTGWSSWGTAPVSNQYAYMGAQSLQTSGANSGVLQSFNATAGTTYTLSVDAMTPAANPLTGSEAAYLEVIFYSSSGQQLTPYAPPNSVSILTASSSPGGALTGSVGNQGWNQYSMMVTAPANTSTVDAVLETGAYNGSGAGGGVVYWDNAAFTSSTTAGVAKVAATSVSNSGSIMVGPTNSLTVSGAFTQTSTGTLNLQFGGAPSTGEFGSVSAGSASLAGTLQGTIVNGYVPSVSDVFTPVLFASETGSFTTFQFPSSSGYQLQGAVTFTNVVVAAVPTTSLTTTVNAASVVHSADTGLLGVNLAYWDSALTTSQTQQLVQSAGLTTYRFPGGSSSDEYHFNLATNLSDSAANTISQFAQFIQAVGGTGLVTTDYGSGSPQEAAAELAYLQGSPSDTTQIGAGLEWNSSSNQWQSVNWGTVGYWATLRTMSPLAVNDGLNFLRIAHAAPFTNIKYWEIGNEEYGSWEIDYHGTAGPGGVSTGAQHDPATYAAFAEQFAAYAKEITTTAGVPGISIGIDSGDPTGASDNNWTKNVLLDGAKLSFTPNFISDHSYVEAPGSESDSFLLNDTVSDSASLFDWSTRYADYSSLLQATLGAQAANVQVMATEFNSVYSNPGKQSTSLVDGLFVADSIGSLLDSGYSGGYLWDLRNSWSTGNNTSESLYGWRLGGDYGILGDPTVNQPPATGAYEPYPSYFAEQLAGKLVQAGAQVVSTSTNYQDFDAYGVLEPNGHLDLLVINANPAATLDEQFNLSGFQPSGSATVWQYGEAQDTAQSQSANGSAALATSSASLSLNGASFSYSFPAYSMTVIDLAPAVAAAPSVTVQPANQSVSAGASATFTAAANGNPTPTVQWQLSTNGGASFSPISGATSTTLALANVTPSQNGYLYDAIFTNSAGTATTNPATLTVNAITTTISLSDSGPNPSIVGQAAAFSATTTGIPNGDTVTLEDASDGDAVVGTITINNNFGSANVTNLSAGATATTHQILAIFSAAGNYAGSQSSQVAQVIDPIQLTSVAINQDYIPITAAAQNQTPGNPNEGVVTLTTDGASGFTPGNMMTIGGYTGNDAALNGTWSILNSTVVGATNQITFFDPMTLPASFSNDNAGYALSLNTTSDLQPGGLAGNGHQRSMVDSIAYTFNTPVNLTQTAVTLGLINPSSPPNGVTVTTAGSVNSANWAVPSTTLTPINGGLTWVLTFNVSTGQGHSIADGAYSAAFDNTQVTAAAGGSQMTTTHATDYFYRLFGDTLGNGRISSTDITRYGSSGANDTDAGYLMEFDYNGDGRLTSTDLTNLGTRNNGRLVMTGQTI